MVSSKDSKKRNKRERNKHNRLHTAGHTEPAKWVVVQLTAIGEREKNISLIEKSARQILKRSDIPVFVPAISQKVRDESLTTWYSDGYVFIRYEDGVPYSLLQDTTYFANVLAKPTIVNGSKKLVYSLLDDKDLDPMRTGMEFMKVSRFSEDDRVKIVKGNFKNLTGKVSCVYDGEENVQVFVKLRSKEMFIDFPASYLEKLDD